MTASRQKFVRTDRPGAVLVWVVLSLSVIVGVVAIVLDGGRQFTERRRDQAAANAAALAGGANLYANYWTNNGTDPLGTAQAAAVAAAEANGVPAGGVTVNIPPQSGSFAGQAGYVEVIIQTNLSASFGRVFTQQDLSVQARAVARGKPMQIGLILLAPSGDAAGQFARVFRAQHADHRGLGGPRGVHAAKLRRRAREPVRHHRWVHQSRQCNHDRSHQHRRRADS